MDHIEPDELAVLALEGREPDDDAARAHLAECAECRAEYDTLARTAALGRAGVPEGELEAPPASVWAGIHAELGLAPELAGDPLTGGRAVATPAAPAEPRPVAELPSRRRPWWPIAVAAAVGGILVGVGVGVAIGGLGDAEPTPVPAVVLASADLAAFPGWDGATGHATVEEDADGIRSIVVDLDASVPQGDVSEVWLIRSDASGLVSLGLLDGSSGRFVLPAGIDLTEFTLVDVSAEPVDGDPAHSGDSIVRGELVES
ncbi:anti-sigma factor [Agromyces mariniharenae]|nr:anti-sigma factor [Agromyces mariniharenae]